MKLLLGQLPADGVLERVGLLQYLPLVQALRTGSVLALSRALTVNQHRFIMEVPPAARADAAFSLCSLVLYRMHLGRIQWQALCCAMFCRTQCPCRFAGSVSVR